MTFRQRDMHDIVLHIVETAAQARCAIHLCTYCRKIKPLLTRTTYRKEEQVCRGADMRGGGTGGEKERGVLLVPVLWAGRGFSRIPRTFLPHAHPQRKKERRTDRKQDGSRRSYRTGYMVHCPRHVSFRPCCFLGSALWWLRSPTTTITDDASQF